MSWGEVKLQRKFQAVCTFVTPTLLGIYINKLEGCLEKTRCVDTSLARIVIILILYVEVIVLMARSPFDLDKQLKILKYFCFGTCMIVNIDKTKVTTIKSKKITYTNLMHDNNNLEEVTSYKYLKINLHHKLH
jgi:hypothetical protein